MAITEGGNELAAVQYEIGWLRRIKGEKIIAVSCFSDCAMRVWAWCGVHANISFLYA